MSLHRQGGHYLVFGALQWVLDSAVAIGLSHFGMPVEAAKVCGRIVGAMLGFWLNGKITFAGDDTTIGRRQLRRFALMWLCLTLISMTVVGRIDDVLGLRAAQIAMPAVELVLGLIGFLLSRHWVYKT